MSKQPAHDKAKGKAKAEPANRTIALNKRARHEYHLIDRVEAAIADLETALKGDDKAQIEARAKVLEEAGQSLYAAAAAASQGDAGAAGGDAGGGQDDVVDAEFTEVKDDEKK